MTSMLSVRSESTCKIVNAYCGNGKTQSQIPGLIKSRKLGQEVWVLAPNRVVARECLSSMTTSVEEVIALATSDATREERTPESQAVTVTAHATALRRLLKRTLDLKGKMVIVDEYHMGQAETVALV